MENNEVEIDLMRLVKLLLANIVVIIVSAVIVGGVFFIVSKNILPVKYTSSIKLYIMNNRQSQSTGEIMLTDINASQELVSTYSVVLKDDYVMDKVGDKLLEKWDPEELSQHFDVVASEDGSVHVRRGEIANCVSMSAVNETEILEVRAETGDPKLSADVCNAVTEVAPECLSDIMGIAYVNPIGYAQVPVNKSSPNNTKNALIGVILGILLSAGFFVIRELISNTVDDAESITTRFELPVLAEIPVYTSESNGGGR